MNREIYKYLRKLSKKILGGFEFVNRLNENNYTNAKTKVGYIMHTTSSMIELVTPG